MRINNKVHPGDLKAPEHKSSYFTLNPHHPLHHRFDCWLLSHIYFHKRCTKITLHTQGARTGRSHLIDVKTEDWGAWSFT
jgi:hypothetical protein